jgi:hypothetical protein
LLSGVVVTVLGLAMISPGWAQPAVPDHAIEMARSGRTAEALKVLEEH